MQHNGKLIKLLNQLFFKRVYIVINFPVCTCFNQPVISSNHQFLISFIECLQSIMSVVSETLKTEPF